MELTVDKIREDIEAEEQKHDWAIKCGERSEFPLFAEYCLFLLAELSKVEKAISIASRCIENERLVVEDLQSELSKVEKQTAERCIELVRQREFALDPIEQTVDAIYNEFLKEQGQ